MGRNNFKRPGLLSSPPEKGPRVAAPVDNVPNLHPLWLFRLMDLEGPWGWKRVEGQDLLQIQCRLASFEQMTWREIDSDARSCGLMPVEIIAADAQKRLVAIGQEDIPALYKLRITKRGRVWGVRDRHVLRLLWWDPEHTVYPMNPTDN